MTMSTNIQLKCVITFFILHVVFYKKQIRPFCLVQNYNKTTAIPSKRDECVLSPTPARLIATSLCYLQCDCIELGIFRLPSKFAHNIFRGSGGIFEKFVKQSNFIH